jgi:hypothetical protein
MAAAISVGVHGVPAGNAETLHDPWVGVDLAADRVARARLLRAAHEVVLSGRGRPSVLREVIVRSWLRCRRAHVDPDGPAPIVLDGADAAARFATHPIAAVLPTVRAALTPLCADARHLVALSDADGVLLWAEGHPSMLEAAVGPRFLPGSLVSERAVGTNAVGTALALDHAIQVFSAEHFNRRLHGWSGAAAPIHDDASGAVLGTVSLSGSFRTAHPHTLALVATVARAAEAELAGRRRRRETELTARYIERLPGAGSRPSALVAADGRVLCAAPHGWLEGRLALPPGADGTVLADRTRVVVEPFGDGARLVWAVPAGERRVPGPAVHVGALAPRAPIVVLDGRRLPLSARQVELVVVLALHPDGLPAHGLAEALYGCGAKTVSVRAEVARLRRRVGDVVLARPYRLAADVSGDVVEVDRLIRRGAVDAAARLYTGPLLPASTAPAIVAARARLEQAVNSAGVCARYAGARHRDGLPSRPPTAVAHRLSAPV